MKFCKDCKYLDHSMVVVVSCKHPTSLIDTNLVTGKNHYRSAELMRAYTECGPDAKLFEQKISWFKKWL